MFSLHTFGWLSQFQNMLLIHIRYVLTIRPVKSNVLFLIRKKDQKRDGRGNDNELTMLTEIVQEYSWDILIASKLSVCENQYIKPLEFRCNFNLFLIGLEICFKNWETAENIHCSAMLMPHGSFFLKPWNRHRWETRHLFLLAIAEIWKLCFHKQSVKLHNAVLLRQAVIFCYNTM